jgi:hypothetical protein
MPGQWISHRQEKIYMNARHTGHTQIVSAAKAGFSERSGREIEKRQGQPPRLKTRGCTLKDPLIDVWDSELIPMLEKNPDLSAMTLLEYLQERFDGEYPDAVLRTLQRRVKQWKSLHGPEKTVMFRQEHPPGRLGLSDFTSLKNVEITVNGKPLQHLLYHFRLSCSHWSHVKVILGGESYTALTEGLQEALWRLGGAPALHRTDSLSAAFKNINKDEKEDITERYNQFCLHFGMEATRNNLGQSHENGSIESSHGHIKRRIKQALLLRENSDFESVEAYQHWMDSVINQHNRRNAKSLTVELPHLIKLPLHKAIDFTEVCARVSSSSTISVRRVTYTVPSRLEGENLRIHLYHDRLECFLGAIPVITLRRVYPAGKNESSNNINYRHVIHSLIKKPQAFRYSKIRDDLLPGPTYMKIWTFIDKHVTGRAACKLIVGLLHLAAESDCEAQLGDAVLHLIEHDKPIILSSLQQQFSKRSASKIPEINVHQHTLSSYNELILSRSGVCFA